MTKQQLITSFKRFLDDLDAYQAEKGAIASSQLLGMSDTPSTTFSAASGMAGADIDVPEAEDNQISKLGESPKTSFSSSIASSPHIQLLQKIKTKHNL